MTWKPIVQQLPADLGRRPVLAVCTAGILLVHLASIAFLAGPRAVAMTNFMQTAAAFAAFVCAVGATKRGRGVAKIFWGMLALSFGMWTTAQALATYSYVWLGESLPRVSIANVLFRFYSAPIAMLLLLDDRQEEEGTDWQRVLDLVQLGTIVFLWYLIIDFGTAWRLQLMDSSLIDTIYALNPINWLLAVASILKANFSPSAQIRALWSRFSVYLFTYALLAGTGNYLAGVWNPIPVGWFDVLWTTPLLLGAVLAATWNAETSLEEADVRAPKGRPARNLEIGVLAVLPLVVALLGSLVANDQRWLAVLATAVSLACYGARLVLTQKKQEENYEALRTSEERYRTLFESNLMGVARTSMDGRVLECNDALASMFGYTRAEVLGRDVNELYPEGMDRAARIANLKKVRSLSNVEAEFRHRDGRLVSVLQNVAMRTERDGTEVVETTLVDLSERKLLEQQLFQAQKMEAVGRLAGGVAHDFNNLLSVILGYSDLLVEAMANDATNRARAEGLRGAGERAAALTRQLLAFSRQQVLEPRVLDLRRTVMEMQTLLRRLIGEDILLVILPGKNPALVKADPSQIEQVIMNLAVNARDAMPRGGKLTIEIEPVDVGVEYARRHQGAAPGEYIMLALSDTGEGMDEETRARIFEPFFTTKEKGKGTGQGLATVFGIVKQSGGHIWFYSEPQRGTTFKIFLPRVADSPEPERTARDAVRPAGGSESILVVEDETSLRELTTEFLVHGGYAVRAARNGEEALELLAHNPGRIHLLLTDVVLPGMSGRTLAEKMLPQCPGLRVLYVSGYTANAIVHHGVLDPGLWFLQKPFSRDALLRKVREILDGGLPA